MNLLFHKLLTTANRKPQQRGFQPRIDALETRLVPTAFLDISNGQLIYNASNVGNLVTVSTDGGMRINDAGETISLSPRAFAAGWRNSDQNTVTGPAGSVSGMEIKLGGGMDLLFVPSTNIPIWAYDEVGGDNSVVVGQASNGMGSIAATVRIVTSHAGTYLTLEDRASTTGKTVTVDTASYWGSVRGLSAGNIEFIGYGMKSVAINGGQGADVFNVEGTGFVNFTGGALTDIPVTIKGGLGWDRLNVGNSSNSLDAVRSSVTFHGEDGSGDAISIRDQGTTAGKVYKLTTNMMHRSDRAAIHYSGAEALELNGSSGGNDIRVLSKDYYVGMTINAGAAGDYIFITPESGNLDHFQGYLTVNGQGQGIGQDVLELYDWNNTYNDAFTIKDGKVSRGYSGVTTYGGIEKMYVRLGNNGATVNVKNLTPWPAVTVFGGTGTETINVGDDANSLSGVLGLLNLQNVTTVNLNDQGNSANSDYVLTNNSIARSGLNPVSFSGTSLVNVNAGSGWNRLNVQGMPTSQVAFHGGGGTDTVESTQFLGNLWQITSADAGNLNSLVAFDGVETLRGGLAEDTYRFSNGATLSGTLGDNGGTDTLDYSPYQSNVKVQFGWGLATGIGNAQFYKVYGIENATGGSGNDMLLGNDANNILRGGQGNDILLGYGGTDQLFGDHGRDFLIGGTGADVLWGGTGEDLLIGGKTSWDQDTNALTQIMSEWSRLDRGYYDRAMSIYYGGGLTGGYRLDSSTVADDGAADQLLGGAKDADWFFSGPGDTNDLEPGEWIN